MTAPDLTPEQRATEPTEPGWYAYSGGRQTMIFHLRETRDWKMTASSANASKGMQWSAHFDNGTAADCAWGYIEQALGVWDLVRLDPDARAEGDRQGAARVAAVSVETVLDEYGANDDQRATVIGELAREIRAALAQAAISEEDSQA